MKQRKRGKKVQKIEKKRSTIRKRGDETDKQHTAYETIFPKINEYGIEILPRIYICNECNKVLHFDVGEKAKREMKCDTFLYQIKAALSELVYTTFIFISRRSLIPGVLDRCLHRGEDDNLEQIKNIYMRKSIEYFDNGDVPESELVALLVYLYYHKKDYNEK